MAIKYSLIMKEPIFRRMKTEHVCRYVRWQGYSTRIRKFIFQDLRNSWIYAILYQQAITEMPGLSLQDVHFLDILLTHCTY